MIGIMETRVIYGIVFVLCLSNIYYAYSEKKMPVLLRRKRYVVFPEGSSLTVAFCITMNLIEVNSQIFTELINFGINYDLPNTTLVDFEKIAQPKQFTQRRYRRDLYNKIAIIMDNMGYNGRSCVYKALCETAQSVIFNRENLLEEVISRIFRFPLDKLHNAEPEDHRLYHWAHRMGFENKNCQEFFPACDISLLDVILGYKKNNNL